MSDYRPDGEAWDGSEVQPDYERVPLPFEIQGPGFGIVDWLADDVVYEIPCYMAQDSDTGDPLMMHWFNTRIRLFPRTPSANHLEYDSGECVVGVQVDDEQMGYFKKNMYPTVYWAMVDPSTQRWLATAATKHLDAELDGLDGN